MAFFLISFMYFWACLCCGPSRRLFDDVWIWVVWTVALFIKRDESLFRETCMLMFLLVSVDEIANDELAHVELTS